MKYFIRAVKYFFYLLIILALIITVLIIAGFVEGDISKIFVNGYDSLWQIALIMAVFAAIYPRLGFSSRTAHVYGSPEEVEDRLTTVMGLHGYKLGKKDGQTMAFVKRSPFARAINMWEDTITVCPAATGLELEGRTKDLVRLVSGLEAANRPDA